jgi:hypothetical protein
VGKRLALCLRDGGVPEGPCVTILSLRPQNLPWLVLIEVVVFEEGEKVLDVYRVLIGKLEIQWREPLRMY